MSGGPGGDPPRDRAATEALRLREQERLDWARTPSERNRLGQFATPPLLARAVVELAARCRAERGDTRPIRFLDPGVGTGAFFGAVLDRFGPKALAQAVGIEVDPAVAAVARAVWLGRGLDLVDGDFTQLEPPADATHRFNLILANPPYVRHHHLARPLKPALARRIHEQLGLAVSGLTGLYGYFLLLADAWLAEGGVAVWLVPAEFLDVNYGAALRAYLTTRVTLLRIHRFRPADAQFEGTLVTSAVVAFAQEPAPPGHQVRLTAGGSLAEPEQSRDVDVATLAQAAKWSAWPVATAPVGAAITLGDLFTIRRGIATGSNRFFVMPRAEAAARGIPAACVRPIMPSPRYLKASVIEADPDGYPRLDRSLVVLACDRAAAADHDDSRWSPGLAAYLAEGQAQGVHATYLASRRTPWFAQEQRLPAPFLCSYMGRPGPGRPAPVRFFWNQSAAIAANVYLMLYPRGALRDRLATAPELHAAVLDRLTAIPAEAIAAAGRVYGGGLHKVEPSELAALRLDGFWDGL